MSRTNIATLQAALLAWYGRTQRVLPWRARKGMRPDPYHVWLSEIMLQQTTVVTVGPYFNKFIDRWPTVADLAWAKLDDVLAAWAGLGYYARARNLHKCAQCVIASGGHFPDTEEGLLQLPGIGPYTAAAIASIAFDKPAAAVDGNVERVISRFYAIEDPLPKSKPAIRDRAAKLVENNPHPGDFTQALMELGATVCTPRNPKCDVCPWHKGCRARAKGIAVDLPRKIPKAARPVRYGKVFFITRKSGAVLIEKRMGAGLYEGMYQLPTTDWVTDKAVAKSFPVPYKLRFQPTGQVVRHIFTHFELVLDVYTSTVPAGFSGYHGTFVPLAKLDAYALPTLMKKAIKLCA